MLLVTVTLWALNFSVSKYILDHGFTPLTYSATRYGAAALIFVGIVLAWARARVAQDLALVAAAVALLLTNQLSFVFALDLSTATTVALLFGTLPIFTALIARLVGVEQLGNRFWLAAALSFGGVVLVTAGSDGGLSAHLLGNLLAVLGAATWGGYSVAIAPLMQRYSPFRLSAIFLLAVFLALVVPGPPSWPSRSGISVRKCGLCSPCNARAARAHEPALVHGHRSGRPSRAALFANLQPFLAAIIALVLLSEELTMLQVAGGFAIAAASSSRAARSPWRADVIEKRIGKLAARPVSAVAEVAGRGYTRQATPRHLRGRLDCLREGRGQRDTAEWLAVEHVVYSQVEGSFLPRFLGYDDAEPALLLLEDLSEAHWPPPWPEGSSPPSRSAGEDRCDLACTECRRRTSIARSSARAGRSSSRTRARSCRTSCARASGWPRRCRPCSRRPARHRSKGSRSFTSTRSDNIALQGDRAVLVDWNWACIGNPVLDRATWAPSPRRGRPPPEELVLECPPGFPAMLAGFALRVGLPPPDGAAPGLRDLQLAQLGVLPGRCGRSTCPRQ